MTAPVTTDALVDQIARILDPDAHHLGLPDYYGPEPILAGASARVRVARKNAGAVLAGPLAPHLAAHQQVTAERDEARAELHNVDLALEGLVADTPRAAAICRWIGQCQTAEDQRDTATAEAARLRGDVEAKDRARDDALMALKVYVESGHGGAMCEVREWLRAGAQGPVPFYDGALFRMWAEANGIVSREGFLARAATAREG